MIRTPIEWASVISEEGNFTVRLIYADFLEEKGEYKYSQAWRWLVKYKKEPFYRCRDYMRHPELRDTYIWRRLGSKCGNSDYIKSKGYDLRSCGLPSIVFSNVVDRSGRLQYKDRGSCYCISRIQALESAVEAYAKVKELMNDRRRMVGTR